jgi:hypothetical protein
MRGEAPNAPSDLPQMLLLVLLRFDKNVKT